MSTICHFPIVSSPSPEAFVSNNEYVFVIDKTVIINQKDVSTSQITGIKDTLQKGQIKKAENKESNYDVKIILVFFQSIQQFL